MVIILHTDKGIRTLLAETLRKQGYQVFHTDVVEHAFAKLQDLNAVGFICSFSWSHAGTSGSYLIQRAKTVQPNLVYILFSLSMDFIRKEAQRVGAHFVEREADDVPSISEKAVGEIASLLRDHTWVVKGQPGI